MHSSHDSVMDKIIETMACNWSRTLLLTTAFVPPKNQNQLSEEQKQLMMVPEFAMAISVAIIPATVQMN